MKTLMLIGGILGFGIGLAFGWWQGSPSRSVILNACIAAYAAGFLLRWWGQLWVRGLREALEEKQAAALAAAELSETNSKS